MDTPMPLATRNLNTPMPLNRQIFALTPDFATAAARRRLQLGVLDTTVEVSAAENPQPRDEDSYESTNRKLVVCDSQSENGSDFSGLHHSVLESSAPQQTSKSLEPTEESWVYEKSETSFALETDNTDESASY